MTALYLVRDGDRTVSLAAERDGKLHVFIPNLDAFVYNKPMSVDFLIDRNMTYEPVTAPAAAEIINEGVIGKLDGRSHKTLLDWARAEPRRLDPAEVLGANTLRADIEPTPAEVAHAKAEMLRKAPPGRWIVYKTYPVGASRQTALQMASDLRLGRVRAFADIALKSRVRDSEQGHHVVQIARDAPAAKTTGDEDAAPPAKPRRQTAGRQTMTRNRKGTLPSG